jgi:hypothetical protein
VPIRAVDATAPPATQIAAGAATTLCRSAVPTRKDRSSTSSSGVTATRYGVTLAAISASAAAPVKTIARKSSAALAEIDGIGITASRAIAVKRAVLNYQCTGLDIDGPACAKSTTAASAAVPPVPTFDMKAFDVGVSYRDTAYA